MLERREAKDEMGGNWMKAHRALLQLARERSALEGREGKGLLRALRSGVHLHLGYGSFVEYVERLFGFAARTTLDKLRTAEALEKLPELERALALGEASWSAVREVARVATAETEREWLEASKGRTVRDIERLVAGREPGDRPSDAARPSAERHVLRFEVTAETLATFREAMKELRQQSGGHVDDDTALLLMSRRVLCSRDAEERRSSVDGVPSIDAGRASYQLAFTVCERCQRGFQEGDGERIEVDGEIVEMASCDAQHIGNVGSPGARAHAGLPRFTSRGLARRVARDATPAPKAIPPAMRSRRDEARPARRHPVRRPCTRRAPKPRRDAARDATPRRLAREVTPLSTQPLSRQRNVDAVVLSTQPCRRRRPTSRCRRNLGVDARPPREATPLRESSACGQATA